MRGVIEILNRIDESGAVLFALFVVRLLTKNCKLF